MISFDLLSWYTSVILKYCIVDKDIDEIGQLELQFASMNICSAESTTNIEYIEVYIILIKYLLVLIFLNCYVYF